MPRVGTKELADHVEWTALKRTAQTDVIMVAPHLGAPLLRCFPAPKVAKDPKRDVAGPCPVRGGRKRCQTHGASLHSAPHIRRLPASVRGAGAGCKKPGPTNGEVLPTSAQSNANLWHTCSVQSVVTD